MQDLEVASLLRDAMLVSVKLAGPPLAIALLTGTVMSLIQAITQINEQTLAFLPKVAAIFGTMLLLGSFMMTTLGDFTRAVMDRIVGIGAS